MFENLKYQLEKEHARRAAEARYYIQHGYIETWADDRKRENDDGLKRHSTETRWKAYQEGRITREKAIEFATARALKGLEKEHARKLEKLASAEAAPDVKSIAIHVEWKRSATWGYNPHAAVIVNHTNRYTGSASGCGYDKRTAAIADALNQNASVRRMLYLAKEKALQAGYDPESAKTHGPESNRHCIAYGAGYGTLPYFEGGVGMASFYGVVNACGMKVIERDERGKHYDFYYIERGENE